MLGTSLAQECQGCAREEYQSLDHPQCNIVEQGQQDMTSSCQQHYKLAQCLPRLLCDTL
jgi:hypothetical protein